MQTRLLAVIVTCASVLLGCSGSPHRATGGTGGGSPGGSGGAGAVWYDDMVVAKQHIGCIR
jgi:hypothetical protein